MTLNWFVSEVHIKRRSRLSVKFANTTDSNPKNQRCCHRYNQICSSSTWRKSHRRVKQCTICKTNDFNCPSSDVNHLIPSPQKSPQGIKRIFVWIEQQRTLNCPWSCSTYNNLHCNVCKEKQTYISRWIIFWKLW